MGLMRAWTGQAADVVSAHRRNLTSRSRLSLLLFNIDICDHQNTTTMASNELSQTLGFLADAAHLLATTAPETSAFLMRKRDALVFENEIPRSEAQRQHVCSCCGHIMVLGRGSILTVDSGKRSSAKGASSQVGQHHWKRENHQSGPTKIIKCGHCQKVTKVKFSAPAQISRHKIKGKASKPAPAAASASASAVARPSQEEPLKSTANASSKKRAKSRKAGGLQALLEQSKASKGTGLGLSLADFMQK